MTRLRTLALAALLALGLAFPAHAVVPTCTGNITSVYWVVTDTNQSTQVYDPNRGYVANTDATYATWLAGIGACPVSGGSISAAVSNGGLVEFTVASSANMVTGQVWQVYGTDAAVYDGKWTITVTDGTHVTLQGSTYSVGVTGGAFYGPQVTPTNAGLMANVNNYNSEQFAVLSFGYNSVGINSSSHLVLTNPLLQNQAIDGTGDGGSPCYMNTNMPQMNVVGSYPVGTPLYFSNFNTLNSATACILRVYKFDGTTLLGYVQPGQSTAVLLTANTTPNGTEVFLPPSLSLAYLQGSNGPLGAGLIVSTGNGGAIAALNVGSTTGLKQDGTNLSIDRTQANTWSGVQTFNDAAIVFGGKALATEIAAPSTPAAGKVSIWVDSTDARFHDKNPAGTVGTTVVSSTCATNNFSTGHTTAGVQTCAQPSVSNLSGLGTGVATALGNAVNSTGGAMTAMTECTSYTPTDQSGASLTFTAVSVQYCQYDNLVYVYGTLTYPSTASAANSTISLPVAVPNQSYAVIFGNDYANIALATIQNSSTAGFYNAQTGARYTNVSLSTVAVKFMLIYPAQ
jgi:hypothetical protein